MWSPCYRQNLDTLRYHAHIQLLILMNLRLNNQRFIDLHFQTLQQTALFAPQQWIRLIYWLAHNIEQKQQHLNYPKYLVTVLFFLYHIIVSHTADDL